MAGPKASAIVLMLFAPLASIAGTTYRVSVGVLGSEPNNLSYGSVVSGNGRFVAFSSEASNLVPVDTNDFNDVFVYDRLLGTTERVSVSTSGLQGDDNSGSPTISYDGRYVSFQSSASGMIQGDTNEESDVFVYDRLTRETTRVSESSAGLQGNAGAYGGPGISPDGRVVVFTSFASNLVAGDTNGHSDVFIRDRATGQTSRISVSNSGLQANSASYAFGSSASYDGRYIAFQSHATNLVAGDTNNHPDVFVRDVVGGTTVRVSLSSTNVQATQECQNPAISYDGRFVAFETASDNMIQNDTNGGRDVFLRDTIANQTTRVSVGTGGIESNWAEDSFYPSMDSTGRFVSFHTSATNFSPEDPDSHLDVYVHDRVLSITTLCSKPTIGGSSSGYSDMASLSGDGSVLSFSSTATNLDLPDQNGEADIFVHALGAQVLFPNAWQRIRGVQMSGNLTSLLSSDDDKLVLRPGIVFTSGQAPIEISVDATTSIERPSRIQLYVESSASSSSIQLTLALHDFTTNQRIVLGVSNVTTSDSTVSRFTLDNPARFIDLQGRLRAILSWKATGPLFAYPWQCQIDHVYFAVSPY
ncbi:MAG: calcium-binding protein [Armatimonadota bacterium]|nr:calcium-binding protein [Armatimonadota bacterium]